MPYNHGMATAVPRRHERLEARITPEQKELLQRAAALAGTSLTDFVLTSARRAAERTIREHEVLTLTAREGRAFVEDLLGGAAPAAALLAAAEHYDRVMRAD